VRHDAPRHPSPDAGVAEAAFAAALGLRLGVANSYGDVVEDRPILGSGRPPGPHDIAAAVDLSRDVTWLLAGLLVFAGTAGAMRRWPASDTSAIMTGRDRSPHGGQRAGNPPR
jgi:adenosylcobinamide-phosphate synthase